MLTPARSVVLSVLVASALALVAGGASGHARRPASGAACTDQGWPKIVSGRLAVRLSPSGTNYALSHAAGTWRLAMRGARGTTLSGSVTSDRAVRLVRGAGKLSGRRVSFSVGGSTRTRR